MNSFVHLLSLNYMRFIHVVGCINGLLLSAVEWYSVIWICHYLLVYSSDSRYLGSFHFGAIINKGATSEC